MENDEGERREHGGAGVIEHDAESTDETALDRLDRPRLQAVAEAEDDKGEQQLDETARHVIDPVPERQCRKKLTVHLVDTGLVEIAENLLSGVTPSRPPFCEHELFTGSAGNPADEEAAQGEHGERFEARVEEKQLRDERDE